MATFFLFLAFILGAISYRIRGGVFASIMPDGDVASRMVWASSTCLAIAAASLALLYAWSCVPHGWAQNGDIIGCLGMSAILFGTAACPVALIWWLAEAFWWPMLAGGAMAGPAYWIGYHLPKVTLFPGLAGGSEWGEALTGGFFWLGIGVSYVLI